MCRSYQWQKENTKRCEKCHTIILGVHSPEDCNATIDMLEKLDRFVKTETKNLDEDIAKHVDDNLFDLI